MAVETEVRVLPGQQFLYMRVKVGSIVSYTFDCGVMHTGKCISKKQYQEFKKDSKWKKPPGDFVRSSPLGLAIGGKKEGQTGVMKLTHSTHKVTVTKIHDNAKS